MVGRQPNAPAAFTPGEIPDTHFQGLSRPQGTRFRWEPRKKSPVTPPGIDPGTARLVVQCLNHYATPGPYRQFYISLLTFREYILIIKANEMHHFSDLFDKVLCMFRTGPLSITRSISTLYTHNRYLSDLPS